MEYATALEYTIYFLMVCLLTLGVLVFLYARKFGSISEGLLNRNKDVKGYDSLPNHQRLIPILEIVEKMTQAEKEIIIEKCFGRPIRVVSIRDDDGGSWLEGIGLWESTSEVDSTFHLSKNNNKPREECG